MIQCFLGLGSNLNTPLAQLKTAINALAQVPLIDVVAASSFYQSLPMGPSEQPDYINAVVEVHTQLACTALLKATQKIELEHGRVRKDERWGPRTLDIDILLYGQQIINEPNLIVPHYGMKQREFVLYPLAELAPELILPCNTPIKTLLAKVDSNGLKRLPK